MQLLPPNHKKTRRKRFRGQKRYFEKILREAAAYSISTTEHKTWDFWHYHADWNGLGNRAWKYRFEHLRALIIVFCKIYDLRKQIPLPFQCWIRLDGNDAGCDATFLHSPKPNETDFPYVPANVEWNNLKPCTILGDLQSLGAASRRVATDLDSPMMTQVHLNAFPFSGRFFPDIPIRIGIQQLNKTGRECFFYSPELGVPLE